MITHDACEDGANRSEGEFPIGSQSVRPSVNFHFRIAWEELLKPAFPE